MNRGGAETLIMNLYRNMDRSKIQFDFLTCKPGSFDSEILDMGGKIYRTPYVTDVGHFGYVRTLQSFFAKHSNYKIVHSHMDKMSGLVLRAAKEAGIPVRIAHSHNTSSEGGMLAKTYKWLAGKHINHSATHRFACSTEAAKWLFGKLAVHSNILQNGIEINNYLFSENIRKVMRRELQVDDDTLVIGHVGRFSPQKNHSFLLEVVSHVIKQNPNTKLYLVGDGACKGTILEKIKEFNIESNVHLLGVRDDVERLLQAFDLFVFPSLHEGLPVSLVEAQSSGLSCLISDNISREVDLGLGLIKYLSLQKPSDWVSEIISRKKCGVQRVTPVSQPSVNHFDIKETAVQTQSTYLALEKEFV